MIPITRDMIREAAPSDDTRRALCALVVANLVETSDGAYAHNENGVFLLPPDGRIVLIVSWTCFGALVPCSPALDVTAYVKRESLTLRGQPELIEIGGAA